MTTRTYPTLIDHIRPGERFQFLSGKGHVPTGSAVLVKGTGRTFCQLARLLLDEWIDYVNGAMRVRRVEG